jgi:hypothetical protein
MSLTFFYSVYKIKHGNKIRDYLVVQYLAGPRNRIRRGGGCRGRRWTRGQARGIQGATRGRHGGRHGGRRRMSAPYRAGSSCPKTFLTKSPLPINRRHFGFLTLILSN